MKLQKIYQKSLYIQSIVVALVCSIVVIAMSIVVGRILDAVLAGQMQPHVGVLIIVAGYLLQVVLSTMNSWLDDLFTVKESQAMRKNLFRAYIHRSTVGKEDIAEQRSLDEVGVPEIVEQVYHGTKHVINCSVSIALCSLSLLSLHWLWATVIIAASVAMIIAPKTLNSKVQKATKAYMDAVKVYQLKISSFLHGHAVVKAYNYAKRAENQFAETNATRANAGVQRVKYSSMVYAITALLDLSQNAVIITSGIIFISTGVTTFGALVAAMQLGRNICGFMEALASYSFMRKETMPTYQQFHNLVDAAPAESKQQGIAVNRPLTLSLQDIQYETNGLPILKGISLTLLPKKKYLMCGESGCGKTTILRVLGGFVQPTAGVMRLNGTQVASYNMSSYRQAVCYISQTPYLFYNTLRENIVLGRDITEEEYQSILRTTNLVDLANRLENQAMDELQLENLSGGEKQRICIARAMVGKPEIYLLDEITASLDKENADNIMSVLFQIDATMLFVCHHVEPGWEKHWDGQFRIQNGHIA